MAISKFVKGITIELGADTTKLGDALNGVDKAANSVQKELREIEKGLKLNPNDTILVAQKQKLLGDAVNTSKERLDALKKAQEQATQALKEGKIGEEAYRALQREVLKAEAEVKSLTKAQVEATSKLKAMQDSLDKFGKGATAAGKTLMPVSAAAGAALAGVVALTVKSAAAADELNTLSKQTGLTTESIQKFQYAADLIDVPLETFTGSLAKLTNNMGTAKDGTGPAADAFKVLGVSITDGVGQLRDNEDVFYDAIDALANMANEAERDALSMQIFGKSAQDLNPLILGGAADLKKYGEEAKKLGLILDQETLDGLNKFNDELDKTKARVSATGMVVGKEFGEVLLPIIEDLAAGVQNLAEWFGELDENTAKTILVVLGIVAAIGPLLLIIGSLAGAITSIIGLFSALSAAAAAAGVSLGAFVLPFVAIGAAIAGVIAAAGLLTVALISSSRRAKEELDKRSKEIETRLKASTEAEREIQLKGLADKESAENEAYQKRRSLLDAEYQAALQNADKMVQVEKNRIQKRLDDLDREHREAIQGIRDEYGVVEQVTESKTDLAKRASQAVIDSLDKEAKKAQELHGERMRQLGEEYQGKLRLLDEETRAQLEALQGQIDSIDDETKAEDKAERERKEQQRVLELQARIAQEGDATRRADLEQDLADLLSEIDRRLLLEKRETQKDAIRTQMDAVKKAAEEQRTLLEEEYALAQEREQEHLESQLQQIEDLKTAEKNALTERIASIQAERIAKEAAEVAKAKAAQATIEAELAALEPALAQKKVMLEREYQAKLAHEAQMLSALEARLADERTALEAHYAAIDKRVAEQARKMAESQMQTLNSLDQQRVEYFQEQGTLPGDIAPLGNVQTSLSQAASDMSKQTSTKAVAQATTEKPSSRSGDIVQHITVISPKPTSPSENARQIKNASRQLAMELQ